jgi:hypothetical protein
MRHGSRVPLQFGATGAMLDLLYLAMGVVVFALFSAYAVGLRRV